jgi:hypothetical protein
MFQRSNNVEKIVLAAVVGLVLILLVALARQTVPEAVRRQNQVINSENCAPYMGLTKEDPSSGSPTNQ